MADKTRAERIEILAAIEHDQWMSWAKSLMENESLSTMRIDRWSSLMVPYSDLPEEMREHDRKWARLALDALPPDPPRGDDHVTSMLKDAIAYYETMMRSLEFTENARANGAQFVIDTVRHIVRGDDLPERDQSADPPRGDGWEALRELRLWAVEHTHKDAWGVDVQYGVTDEIDRLLAAAPKETP